FRSVAVPPPGAALLTRTDPPRRRTRPMGGYAGCRCPGRAARGDAGAAVPPTAAIWPAVGGQVARGQVPCGVRSRVGSGPVWSGPDARSRGVRPRARSGRGQQVPRLPPYLPQPASRDAESLGDLVRGDVGRLGLERRRQGGRLHRRPARPAGTRLPLGRGRLLPRAPARRTPGLPVRGGPSVGDRLSVRGGFPVRGRG